jgi:hypothetical protein
MNQIVKKESKKINNSKFSNFMYITSVIPVVIVTYIQLFYNILVVSATCNTIFKFVNVLENDLQLHIEKKRHGMFNDIMECTDLYIKNKCSYDLVPALEQSCKTWKLCMEIDTLNIMKSKESAEIFAQILNNFFENLSNKTIYCIGGSLVISIILLNIGLCSWKKNLGN